MHNPVIMASGTFGNGYGYAKLYPLDRIGGLVSKGLTLHPKSGNQGTRLHETPSGLMNSIGLENPGIAAFLSQELDQMTAYNTVIIINLGGGTLEDYVEGARLITEDQRIRKQAGRRCAEMIELNISCPNVKEGGMQFGIATEQAQTIVRAVRAATTMPLLVKLSPNAQDLVQMARMCEAEGADGLSLVNTFQAMAIDIKRRRSVFNQIYAGLSGPAIKPIALRMVHQVAHSVRIPVIGIGGISSAVDVLEFIMAGAAAVQIGTYNFMNLHAGGQLEDELTQLLVREGIDSLDEIRGII
jgi:dihydroorotate dehydrogenase (NAD+) catalytic subunit